MGSAQGSVQTSPAVLHQTGKTSSSWSGLKMLLLFHILVSGNLLGFFDCSDKISSFKP